MISRFINHLEEGIISLLLVGMTILVCVEVFMRFVMNSGALWIQETTLLISAWMVLFGASYGIKVGSHIGVDAIIRLLPSNWRRWISAFAALCCLVYCGLFIYGGWLYLEKVYSIHLELEDVPIERWVAHSILIIGFGLLAFRILQLLWVFVTGKADSFSMANEAAEALRSIQNEKNEEVGS